MPNYLQIHPWVLAILSVAATWVFNNIITVMVTSMPAPTATSSEKYKYWFKVLNQIIGNLQRAKSTAIEGSPNWQPAVQAAVDSHLEKLNGKAGG